MKHKKKALVVGGSGFLGKNLCLGLQKIDVDPIVFDRVPPTLPGIEFHQGDFSSVADLWPALLRDVDVVFHLAWTTKPQSANDSPLYDLQTNVVSSVHLLDGIVQQNSPPRIIFVSSGGAVYGQPERLPVSEHERTRPINAYGISKLTFENYLALYGRLFGLDYLVLRPGNPYGEFQDPAGAQGAVAVFMGKMARGEPLTIWGDGEIVRDYLHVDDLTDALLRSIDYQPPETGERLFNVGSGVGLSLNQLIRSLEKATGKSADVDYQLARKTDVHEIVLDNRRLCECMGWTPRVDLDEGLRRTWLWMRRYLALEDG